MGDSVQPPGRLHAGLHHRVYDLRHVDAAVRRASTASCSACRSTATTATSPGCGRSRKRFKYKVHPAEAYLGVEKVWTCLSHKGLRKRPLNMERISMSTSLLYHGFGIRGYRYVRTEYVEGGVVFTIVQDPKTCRCPACGGQEHHPQRRGGAAVSRTAHRQQEGHIRVSRSPHQVPRLQRRSPNAHRVCRSPTHLYPEFRPIRPGTGEDDDHSGCRLAFGRQLGCRQGNRQERPATAIFASPSSSTCGRSPSTRFPSAKAIAI